MSYDVHNPEHQRRYGTVFVDCAGFRLVPQGFQVILAKVSCCPAISDKPELENLLVPGHSCVGDDSISPDILPQII
jgi:hypothetical protein